MKGDNLSTWRKVTWTGLASNPGLRGGTGDQPREPWHGLAGFCATLLCKKKCVRGIVTQVTIKGEAWYTSNALDRCFSIFFWRH